MKPLILPRSQLFDVNGDPAIGYKLFFYQAGTTTKQDTYTTSACTVANTNPVVLDSRGEKPIYLNSTTRYKIVFTLDTDTDPPTSPIWTEDNVDGNSDIYDVNGNLLLKFTTVTSAVNHLSISNNSTGNAPIITATGSDTNIDITLTPKGTGNVNLGGDTIVTGSLTVNGTSTGPGTLVLAEDTDNGSNTITLTPQSSMASNRTLTLPDNNETLVPYGAACSYTDAQNYADGVEATMSLTESWDSQGNFASNTFTVPTGGAGKYLISAGLSTPTTAITYGGYGYVRIKKGGVAVATQTFSFNGGGTVNQFPGGSLSIILNLADADTITAHGFQTNNSGATKEFTNHFSIIRLNT